MPPASAARSSRDQFVSAGPSSSSQPLVSPRGGARLLSRERQERERCSWTGCRQSFRALTAVPYAQISVQVEPSSEVSNRKAIIAFAPLASASATNL